MHASTRVFGLHAVADTCLAHVRKAKTKYWVAMMPAARNEPAIGIQPAADEVAVSALHSTRVHSGRCGRVENAFFAVTLATIGCLYVVSLLTQAW
jgi:hypothetical protein